MHSVQLILLWCVYMCSSTVKNKNYYYQLVHNNTITSIIVAVIKFIDTDINSVILYI